MILRKTAKSEGRGLSGLGGLRGAGLGVPRLPAPDRGVLLQRLLPVRLRLLVAGRQRRVRPGRGREAAQGHDLPARTATVTA